MGSETIKNVVIKIGTSSITKSDGSLSAEKIADISRQASILQKNGKNVIIVTSGSIAAGFRKIGYPTRPKSVAGKQAAAAVGQGILMETYTEEFEKLGNVCAQILLTRDDFADKRRYNNMFGAIEELIRRNVIPIINENDTISIEELKFGDNDTLSAQVAAMIHADMLVILTDIDGLYTADPRKDDNAEHIDVVERIDENIEKLAGAAASELSTGGMRSKITAAALATMTGVPVFICSSGEEDAILKAVERKARGTYFAAKKYNLKTRLQWLAFYTKSKGNLYIDSGAKDALINEGKSLLPSGVIAVEGNFDCGEVVDVFSNENEFLGRGISDYSYSELMAAKGKNSSTAKSKDVIHRNNWVGGGEIQYFYKNQKEER